MNKTINTIKNSFGGIDNVFLALVFILGGCLVLAMELGFIPSSPTSDDPGYPTIVPIAGGFIFYSVGFLLLGLNHKVWRTVWQSTIWVLIGFLILSTTLLDGVESYGFDIPVLSERVNILIGKGGLVLLSLFFFYMAFYGFKKLFKTEGPDKTPLSGLSSSGKRRLKKLLGLSLLVVSGVFLASAFKVWTLSGSVADGVFFFYAVSGGITLFIGFLLLVKNPSERETLYFAIALGFCVVILLWLALYSNQGLSDRIILGGASFFCFVLLLFLIYDLISTKINSHYEHKIYEGEVEEWK